MLTPELRVILQSCSNLHTVHSHTDITDVPIVILRSIQDLKRNLRCVMENICSYNTYMLWKKMRHEFKTSCFLDTWLLTYLKIGTQLELE